MELRPQGTKNSFLDFHIFQLLKHIIFSHTLPVQTSQTSGLMESLNFPSPMTMSSSRKLLKWTSITVSRSPSSRASSMAAQIAFSADSVCVVKDCYIDKGIKAEKSKQYMSTYLLYISYMSHIYIYIRHICYTHVTYLIDSHSLSLLSHRKKYTFRVAIAHGHARLQRCNHCLWPSRKW